MFLSQSQMPILYWSPKAGPQPNLLWPCTSYYPWSISTQWITQFQLKRQGHDAGLWLPGYCRTSGTQWHKPGVVTRYSSAQLSTHRHKSLLSETRVRNAAPGCRSSSYTEWGFLSPTNRGKHEDEQLVAAWVLILETYSVFSESLSVLARQCLLSTAA